MNRATANELVIAEADLAFARAELVIANQELSFQNDEKGKRAAELIIANQELAFQDEEKEKRVAELVIANQELALQNEEIEKRAAELVIANQELAFQNEEKGKRAAELVIANQELAFQNEEKGKRAAELVIAQDSRDRLRELTTRLDEAREDERTILARELHDDVGQNLTAMRMELSSIEQEIPAGWERISASLHSMIAIAQDSVDRVNRLSKELRSPILDMLGLADAVESEVWDFDQRWGTETRLEIEVGELEAFPERDLAIFKILKESLSNVSRHAQASRVEVSLRVVGRELVLEVLDNGIGITIDQTQGSNSFGLMGMRERAERLGGDIEVEPQDEGGTRVRASILIAPK